VISPELAITLPDGTRLYPDDRFAGRYYAMPAGLDLVREEDGAYRFSLLFYQSDFAERGARLVLALQPIYPQPDPLEVERALGSEAEVVGAPVAGGEVSVQWPAAQTQPAPVHTLAGNSIPIEMSLSQAQASALRESFARKVESVRVTARLMFVQATPSLPVIVRINLRQANARLATLLGPEPVRGSHLREAMADLPEEAVQLAAGAGLPGWSRGEILSKCTPALGPLIAGATADRVEEGLTFDEQAFQLRAAERVEDAELTVDLTQPRAWIEAWSAEWSLSDFYQRMAAAGALERYFPEVLHIPAVGFAQVLVENQLTLTPDTIREVLVEIKHRKLGSLEEEHVELAFRPGSGPVASHTVPVVAFTPFRYQYRARLRIAPEQAGGAVETFPAMPQWVEANQPLLELRREAAPYATAFATAGPEVFAYIGRAEVEFAAPEGDPPEPLARVELAAGQESRWLFLRQLPASAQALRWRPYYYPDREGKEQPVIGGWRLEARPWAVLELWDVFPRDPVKVRVSVIKGDTPEIQQVCVQLSSGTGLADAILPDLEWSFTQDESRVFTLWPKTIFDLGWKSRIGATLFTGEEIWTEWTVGQGGEVVMKVEDQFYTQKTVEVELDAPWSPQRSPDPTVRRGEIIYAEVDLSLPLAADTQGKTFTFDAQNREKRMWKIRGRAGLASYRYQVHALSVDGRMHDFGPFDSEKEKLSLTIIRTLVSDLAPPDFSVEVAEN
jgi:hypothetical protein